MAGIVLPALGPLAPLMSIARGDFAGSSVTVPSSFCPPTVTVYLPSATTSVIVLRTSSGYGLPPSSAVTGFQVPCIFLPSSLAPAAPSPRASGPAQTQTSSDQQNRRFTVFLLQVCTRRLRASLASGFRLGKMPADEAAAFLPYNTFISDC